MSLSTQIEARWLVPLAPKGVYAPAAAASGNYQATFANLGKLHLFTSDVDVRAERGNGGTVTATGKTIMYARQWYFTPVAGNDTVGWASVTGNATVTVGVLEE